MSYIINNQEVTYTVSNDGYDIYFDGVLRITQHEPYIPDKTKSYEENAVIQIENMIENFNQEEEYAELHAFEMDDINSLLTDHEYRLTLIELGL